MSRQLRELEPFDRAQQPHRPLAQFEQPTGMARRVIDHPMREVRADVLDIRHVRKERGQLVTRGNVGGWGPHVSDERRARTRGRDYGIESGEVTGELLHERPSLLRIPGVVLHLAATRLRLRKRHLHVEPFEQRDRGDSGVRECQIIDAGDEQGYPHDGSNRRSG
ncbi:MAG TPA: hypothetical protein VFU74_02665 [Actinocrinis sp.]|nr:hypothetical protein [Actinocrinis sp.]